jgi:hypothetical protein
LSTIKEETMKSVLTMLAVLLFTSVAAAQPPTPEDPLQREVREIKEAMPKFGIPMREVGERFQNMYFAAQAGNWGLARYMSRSMNAAMNTTKVTQAYLYPFWEYFYGNYYKPVNTAIDAQDSKAFEREVTAVIDKCNSCHFEMGFAFVKVRKPVVPATQLLDLSVKSKAADFRE